MTLRVLTPGDRDLLRHTFRRALVRLDDLAESPNNSLSKFHKHHRHKTLRLAKKMGAEP